jgi:hypothetical protein
MTLKQKRRIITTIRKDANHRMELVDSSDPSRMCVAGGLAHAAGKTAREIAGMATDDAISFVSQAYGISPSMVSDLVRINDKYYTTETRRRDLIAEVQSWPVSDKYRKQER